MSFIVTGGVCPIFYADEISLLLLGPVLSALVAKKIITE